MTTPCLQCVFLSGCPQLVTNNHFDPKRLLYETTQKTCEFFDAAGLREVAFRNRMIDRMGLEVAYPAIHALRRNPLEEVREEPEVEYDDLPDFRGIIQEGMTVEARREQLLYETDEVGNVLIDEDTKQPIPRGVLVLRNYARSPDGPTKLPAGMALGLRGEQIVDAILKAERELGWIQKSKKTSPKGDTMPVIKINRAKTAEAPAAASNPTKTAKPVIKPKAAPQPEADEDEAVASKVATPATGPKIRKVGGAQPAAERRPAASEDEQSPVEKLLRGLLDQVSALEKKVDKLQDFVGSDGNIILGITATHDAILKSLNNLSLGIQTGLQEGGINIDLFKDRMVGKGKNARPNLDAGLLMGDGKTVLSYFEGGDAPAGEAEEVDAGAGEEELEEDEIDE